jgi:hypothetical protein
MASWSEPALQDLDLSAVDLGASRCGVVGLTYRGKPLEFAIRPFAPRDAELTVCDLPPPRRCLFFGLTVSKKSQTKCGDWRRLLGLAVLA